jgi:hypothetical protein
MRDWERGENDMNWKDTFIGFVIGVFFTFGIMTAIGFYFHVG